MAIAALGYACIRTGNIDKWEQFATGVMGMQARRADDGAVLLRYDVRDWRVRIEEGAEEDVTVLGWECQTEAEFVETLAQLGDKASIQPEQAKALSVVRTFGATRGVN
ncbi:hypothetical protein [Sphingobium phenoxybenzoativorans]|uniref:hypothetical protein n=1 Tax=Sphingobium phenoxybenzoativorans TaxID=1592790 RepID=UPI0008731489|nr:hypothetical protein [Sphingobium phenoxybenzoativorans]